MTIHPAQKILIYLLFVEKVNILEKNLDFANVFSKQLAGVLLECIKINKYTIKLQEGKQLSHGFIYSLGLVELKTLKTYIETNLANGFIWPLKSLANALIFYI